MNTYLDCVPCFLRQALDAVRNASTDEGLHEKAVREVLRLAAGLDLDAPPPRLGQAIHRRIREMTGVDDPYRTAKSHFNQLAMGLLPELEADVKRAPDPLIAAAATAIAANVIDLGAKSALSEDQVYTALRESTRVAVHGDFALLRAKAAGAAEILYLADNAGEIAIDRLLIEALGPERVTLAVRGRAVINDATLVDACEVGLPDLVRVMDNGSDAPGTILEDCSPAFLERFHEADLIISKGQGNFETLSEIDGEIFFLLKVKCPVIAKHIGLPVGTNAAVYSSRAGGRKANP